MTPVLPAALRGSRLPVGVLGATGAVGQTFIRLLQGHPWFELAELGASERSAGQTYAKAAHWLEGEMPEKIAGTIVKSCDPAAFTSPLVFSALDSNVAGEIEGAFARAGKIVFSNAKNYRMEPDVPLVIPEVNGDHLAILAHQRHVRGWPGAIVTNANCATTVAVMALAPLHRKYGVTKVLVVTMQAISGAGYPGVASLDILGNVIPYIGEEEPKVERELKKILGTLGTTPPAIVSAGMIVSAHTNRVPVEHGHLACLSIELAKKATPEEAADAMRSWCGVEGVAGLPSAPRRPIIVTDAQDRPQSRKDVNAGNGMSVTVGRVRTDPMLDLKFVALGHNTIRGAAGGSILNAELLVSRGEIAFS